MDGKTAKLIAQKIHEIVEATGGALVDLGTGESLLEQGVPEYSLLVPLVETDKLTAKSIRKILWDNRRNPEVATCNALGVLVEIAGDRKNYVVSYLRVEPQEVADVAA